MPHPLEKILDPPLIKGMGFMDLFPAFLFYVQTKEQNDVFSICIAFCLQSWLFENGCAFLRY